MKITLLSMLLCAMAFTSKAQNLNKIGDCLLTPEQLKENKYWSTGKFFQMTYYASDDQMGCLSITDTEITEIVINMTSSPTVNSEKIKKFTDNVFYVDDESIYNNTFYVVEGKNVFKFKRDKVSSSSNEYTLVAAFLGGFTKTERPWQMKREVDGNDLATQYENFRSESESKREKYNSSRTSFHVDLQKKLLPKYKDVMEGKLGDVNADKKAIADKKRKEDEIRWEKERQEQAAKDKVIADALIEKFGPAGEVSDEFETWSAKGPLKLTAYSVSHQYYEKYKDQIKTKFTGTFQGVGNNYGTIEYFGTYEQGALCKLTLNQSEHGDYHEFGLIPWNGVGGVWTTYTNFAKFYKSYYWCYQAQKAESIPVDPRKVNGAIFWIDGNIITHSSQANYPDNFYVYSYPGARQIDFSGNARLKFTELFKYFSYVVLPKQRAQSKVN